jgi:hypothetical protein
VSSFWLSTVVVIAVTRVDSIWWANGFIYLFIYLDVGVMAG